MANVDQGRLFYSTTHADLTLRGARLKPLTVMRLLVYCANT